MAVVDGARGGLGSFGAVFGEGDADEGGIIVVVELLEGGGQEGGVVYEVLEEPEDELEDVLFFNIGKRGIF